MLQGKPSEQPGHAGAILGPVRAGVANASGLLSKTSRSAARSILSGEPATNPWQFAVQSVAAWLRGRLGLATLAETKVLVALLQTPGKPKQLAELARATGLKPGSAKVAASRLRASLRRLGLEHHLHGGAVTGLAIDCDHERLMAECETCNGAQPASKTTVVELAEHALRRELKLVRSAEARLLAKLASQPDHPFTTAGLAEATGCTATNLKCYISHLRTSLEQQGMEDWIRTFRQSGLNDTTHYAITARGYAALRRKVSPQLAEALEDVRRQTAAGSAHRSAPALRLVSS